MAFSTSTIASTTLRAHCYSSSSNRTQFVCSRSGWCLLLLLLLFVVVSEIRLVDGAGGTNTHESHKDDAGTYETDDAVIIEALPDTRKGKRSNDEELIASETISEVVSRQQTADRFGKHWSALMPLGTIGTCFTSKGVLGQCTPFRQCYPYFKLPELSNWETWILGMYDTCTYYTEQGRQMFGVCCTNPITPKPIAPKPTKPPVVEQVTTEQDKNKEGEEKMTSSAKPSPNGPHQANWPPTHPPLPTHPPDHTIPPLPTHPPSPGFPFVTPESTTPKPVTTTWPSKPTTKPWPTPQWPPTVPTAPPLPTHPPTTPQPWPPTHPPIPTHPPLPTHPPVPTYPTGPPVVPGGQPVVPPITDGTCGAKNGYQDQERIVGGHSADLGEWPWIAALFNGGRQFCGGSLIDNMHILSAAHCVAHMSSWDVARLTVRLGDHNIKTNSEVTHIEKRVKRVVRHRGFDSRTLYNDVAILTLDTPIQFSKLIRPICLPSGGTNYAGKTATVIGWGSLRESGPQPAVLQEVSIPIWTNGECRQKYGPAAPGGIVEHMLCAGQASRDSCSGDSGGPLMVNDGKWTQVGIVSWGIGCGKGQYPGVYTRVTHFLPWITKNLK